MSDQGVVRFEFDDVDDAVLDPTTATHTGAELTLTGYVELKIAPVTSWEFFDLHAGTGDVIEFRPNA